MRLDVALLVALAGCGFRIDAAGSDASSTDAFDAASVDAAPPTSCTPNTTQCFGHALETCNAAGTGFDSTQQVVCPLTCVANGCVAASNIAEPDQRMCGATAPALTPAAGATITLASGQITCAPNCGAGIATIMRRGTTPNDWYCLSSVNLPSSVTIVLGPGQGAVTWFVHGAATIAHDIDFSGGDATGDLGGGSDVPGTGGPGGFIGGALSQDDGNGRVGLGPCGGGGGVSVDSGSSAAGGGGGGGGYATAGAGGGNGRSNNNSTQANGGAGGAITCDRSDARPLVGGSGGGGGGDGGCGSGVACGWPGGGGGGAFHIASRVQITVTANLDASGGNGAGETSEPGGGGGGGAGGALLLEAPTLNVTGQLRANGGGGGTSSSGAGGTGASGASGPAIGSSAATDDRGGGGGGGAGGRVRLNASSGASCNSSSPAASCTMGPLRSTP